MNKIMANFMKTALLTVGLSGYVYAGHDPGQGKSQDGPKDPLASVSVAPEPSTFWLFIAGAAAIAAYKRHKKNGLT